MAKNKYVLQILFAGGMSFKIFGGSAAKVAIWRENIPNIFALYDVIGLSGGVTLDIKKLFKFPLQLTLFSTSSNFESEVNGLNVFSGSVKFEEAGVTSPYGENLQIMRWTSGPAAGTICDNSGKSINVMNVGASVSVGVLNFKFVSLIGDDTASSFAAGGQSRQIPQPLQLHTRNFNLK